MKKKMIAAVSVAALAAGMASAEVKITMNGRLRPTFFANQNTAVGDNETNTRDIMKLDGYGDFTDTLKLAFNNEEKTAGLTFSVNVTNGNDSKTVGTYYQHEDGTIDTNSKKNTGETNNPTKIELKESNNKFGNFLTLNQFDIWAKVLGTDLMLGAGSWKDGWADGSYRVKKDVDALNAEGLDFERFKLGSAFKSAPSLFVDDLANFYGGSNALAAYLEYPLAIDDQMSLKFTAVAVKSTFDDDSGDKTANYDAGWSGRIQFNMKDMFNSELILKRPVANTQVIAFYAKPTLLKELDATVGGSYTIASGGNEAWNGAFDIDLRARYDLSGLLFGEGEENKFSITWFSKFSSVDATNGKAAAKVNSGIVGLDGKAGGLIDNQDITKLLWNNLSAKYVVVKDMLTASLNVGVINVLSNEGDAEYGLNIRVTPGAQVQLTKGATFWAGVTYSRASYNDGKATTTDDTVVQSWSIPAIFRVKM